MSETARSITFVIVAVVSAGVAWFAKPPDNITPEDMRSAKLGKPFFPEFEDPNAPTSIRVVSYDEKQAKSQTFAVEQKDGLWRIPSRQNYPADAADRLAKTSTSLMGVIREEYMPGGEARHEEFGVLDPVESDVTKLKGRGQRVTLAKGSDVLLDLIIGKPVRERPGHRYLRRADEKSVYVAKINPDLSTKFSDWVETNLLKVSRDELATMEIDNYSISEANNGMGRIEAGEIVRLARDKSSDPWKLDGLDDPEKEVDTTKTNDMVSTLVDLKLTGIRPKPPGLNVDLTIDRKVVKQQVQLELLVADMASKGFIPGPGKNEDDPARLYSKLGELRLTTNKGLAYTLRFGDVFTGSESEIESGTSDAADKKEDEKKEGEDADKEAPKSSRYLLVSVAFDESLLGPKPEKPERPAALDEKEEAAAIPQRESSLIATVEPKPFDPCGQDTPAAQEVVQPEEETKSKPPAEPTADAATPEKKEDAKPAEGTDEPKPADGAPAASDAPQEEGDPGDKAAPAAEPKRPAAKTKQELEREYNALVARYEGDLSDWEAKAKAGREKAEELNRRFKEWYYVIAADNVTKLRLSREQLIRDKKADNGPPGGGGAPFGAGGLPGGMPHGPFGPGRGKPVADELREEVTADEAVEPEGDAKPATDEQPAAPEEASTPKPDGEPAEKTTPPAEPAPEKGEAKDGPAEEKKPTEPEPAATDDKPDAPAVPE
ncbi:MAG: DUF4340 domain-containing protein [Planctomycetota bacterium]|nr:DUF4340 domain-containing protein [Planctomycetota bacterium]